MAEESYGRGPISAASAVATPAPECNVLRKAALVQHFPLFNNVAPADRTAIVSLARECKFSRRQTIFIEGDPVRNVMLLTSGSAKITQLCQNGTEVIVHLVGPGDLVGMTRFYGSCNHSSTAQALSDSMAVVWETNAFKDLVVRFPVFARNIAHAVSWRLQELEERFCEISTETVAARLSHELARLFKRMGHRTDDWIEINFSREELAQLTGTTLFTVSRLLSDWDNRGLVKARWESVSIRDMEALRQLAESAQRIAAKY